MGYGTLIRKNLVLADKILGNASNDGLQDEILIYPWIGSNIEGGPEYGDAVPVDAIVYEREFSRTLPSGDEVVQRAEITIPQPWEANGAPERREPLDPRDKIVLPSGYTGPILHIDGLTDPSTHEPYMFTVILG